MSTAKEEQLDPRIQVELERLNTCTDEINHLETELDEVNGIFRSKLAEGIQKLQHLHEKLGKCIDKAKPYYDARQNACKAQVEAQSAAVQYQRAVSMHQAAKETIRLAEERFVSKQNEWEFDAAWQEMLNHATIKVMEAETNKAKSEQEHQMKAAKFASIKDEVQALEKQLRGTINKARTYYDLKEALQGELEMLKSRIYEIQHTISKSKTSYAESLRNLEMISEQIHLHRKLQEPREPGVGAERDISLPDIILDEMDELAKDSTSCSDSTSQFYETCGTESAFLSPSNFNSSANTCRSSHHLVGDDLNVTVSSGCETQMSSSPKLTSDNSYVQTDQEEFVS